MFTHCIRSLNTNLQSAKTSSNVLYATNNNLQTETWAVSSKSCVRLEIEKNGLYFLKSTIFSRYTTVTIDVDQGLSQLILEQSDDDGSGTCIAYGLVYINTGDLITSEISTVYYCKSGDTIYNQIWTAKSGVKFGCRLYAIPIWLG